MKAIGNFLKIVLSIVVLVLIFYTFDLVVQAYRTNYFNNFVKAELNINNSKFTRELNIKYSEELPYKVESPTYNDAMFYKMVTVKPNTSYKVTCMIKTENVESETTPSDAGAYICISDTTEKSTSITGTKDWTEATMYFNSRNRTSVNIGFRLGGTEVNSKGTVWFTNLKLEQGAEVKDNKWNFACFIFKNMDVKDVKINGNMENVKVSMSDNDIQNIKENLSRFKNDVEKFSVGNLKSNIEIIEINDPITSVSKDEDNGYYISGENISNIINSYLDKNEYQHIFSVVKFGDYDVNLELPVNDWLGLGSMTYRGIGFSNIRIPSDNVSKVYKYSTYNQFPEEVFVHEFLHDLERISKDANLETPTLHNFGDYGYEIDSRFGLSKWYEDYMGNSINYNNIHVGIAPEVYKMKPVGKDELEYSIELDFVKEPSNLIEELLMITKSTMAIISA